MQVKKNEKAQEKKADLRKIQAIFNEVKLCDKVPKCFRLLYKHASSIMKATGASLQIPCDIEVFGVENTIFLLHDSIIELLEFRMIGQAVISAYMMYVCQFLKFFFCFSYLNINVSIFISRYLHTKIREMPDGLETFAFVDPGATFNINDAFESYIVKRLKEGNPDRIFFLPHNEK